MKTHLALVPILLVYCSINSLLTGQVVADRFAEFPGPEIPAEGWLGSWAMAPAQGVGANTIESGAPLLGGGSYLHFDYSTTGSAGNQRAWSRGWDTALIPAGERHHLSFLLRMDDSASMVTHDVWVRLGDRLDAAGILNWAGGDGWRLSFAGNTKVWLVGSFEEGSWTNVNTGMPITDGHVYAVDLAFDPATATYAIALTNTHSGLTFRRSGLGLGSLGNYFRLQTRILSADAGVTPARFRASMDDLVVSVAPQAYTISTTVTGLGAVVRTPDTATYERHSEVVVRAEPGAGQKFVRWVGDVPTGLEGNPQLGLLVFANRTLEAQFEPIPTFELTATANPSNGGQVIRDPDQPEYLEGTAVTLTAQPTAEPAYRFVSWSGDVPAGSSQSPSVTVTMTADRAVVANFELIPVYSLTTDVSPAAGGSVVRTPAADDYLEGTTVSLSALPSAGYRFVSWEGEGIPAAQRGNPNVSVTMTGELDLTATFEAIANLTVQTQGNGSISVSPSGTVFLRGTSVTLTATPAVGNRFLQWSGDVPAADQAERTVTLVLDADRAVTAVFEAIPLYTLNVPSASGGSVLVNPARASYQEGTNVQLVATPDHAYVFVRWSWGTSESSANPFSLTMNSNLTVTPVFALGGVALIRTRADYFWTGGAGQVTVAASNGWVVHTEEDWIQIETPSGTGTTVRFSVSENDGEEREGIIRINEAAFLVRQGPASILQGSGSEIERDGFKWRAQTDWTYDGFYPFVYSFAANGWFWVYHGGATEDEGYFLWDFAAGRWGFTATAYYPYYGVFTGDQAEWVPFFGASSPN